MSTDSTSTSASAEQAHERPDLAGQGGAADLDRLREPHLHGEDDIVRAGVRVHVGQQRLVGRGAGRRRPRVSLGGEIRPHAPPVVGEGRGDPLHPVDGRALAGQRGQHRCPRTDPAVLLVRAQQGEAAAAQRQRGRERARRTVVHDAHVVPTGAQEAQAAQRGHARLARGGHRHDGRPSTRRPGATRHPYGPPRAPSPARRRGRGCRWPRPRPMRWAPTAARARRTPGRPRR